MRSRTIYKKSSRNTAFFDNLEPKKVLSFLLLLSGLYLLYKWFKKSNTDPITTDPQNPQNEDIKADAIKPKSVLNSTWEAVKEDTRKIVHHLGVNYDWYDPRRWTENDKEVAMLLMKQRPNIKFIEDLYYRVYTKNRNLKNDCYKLLDKTELNQVINYYKSKGSIF